MNVAVTIENPYGIKPQIGWSTTTLGELASSEESSIQTGPFGSQLHARDYKPEGTPVVMPQQLGDNTISLEGIARISDEDRDRLSRHIMQVGDIVFSRRGDVTRRAYIGTGQVGWFCGTGCLLIRVKNETCDNRFLSLFFSLPQFKEYIVQKAVGATMPNLNQGILQRVPIVLPALPTQQRIVEVITGYDDLIENNRRRMELLEASARHLYEEWFVRLRFPGHEHTRITNGVPEGWELRPLSECSQFRSGGTPKKSIPEYWDGDIPWISSGEMAHWRLHDSVRKVTEDGAENGTRMVSPGTILAVVRGMSLAKEFRVAMCSRPVTFNQDLKAIVANDGIQPEYLYAAILSQREQIRDRSTEASHGTKKLDTVVLSSTEIKVPTPSLQQTFCDHVQPKHQLWDRCWNQNVKLKAARDHLLPRLMSGEVPV